MPEPSNSAAARQVEQLKHCLEEKRSFWLWGLKGSGKTYRLKKARESMRDSIFLRVVTFFEGMTLSQWAHALSSVLPNSQLRISKEIEEEDGPEEAENLWRSFVRAYSEQSEESFLVVDGWQWMPSSLHRLGVEVLLREGLSCGLVSSATPYSYLRADQVVRFDVIQNSPLPLEEEERLMGALFTRQGSPDLLENYRAAQMGSIGHPILAMLTAQSLLESTGSGELEVSTINRPHGLAVNQRVGLRFCETFLDDLDGPCRRALAVIAHCAVALPGDLLWLHLDRSLLGPAMNAGILEENLSTVTIADPLKGTIPALLIPERADWWLLLRILWENFQRERANSNSSALDPDLVQTLLNGFSQSCQTGIETDQERAFLVEVFDGIDPELRALYTDRRLPAILKAIEEIPAQVLGAMPSLRFRLSQCLMMVGRRSEADKILRGLLRMKNTDVGKRAFLWTQMFAAFEGQADEVIKELITFLKDRVEHGEELDTIAHRVLVIVLTMRGSFRRALPIAGAGVRSARASGSIWDLHLLRNLQGMCLAFTGDQERGLALMHDACESLQRLGMEQPHAEARHLLATVYLELEKYSEARQELRQVRAEYERFQDQRNLRMIDVKSHLIALSLGEEEPPPWSELDETPADTEWSYYQAELSFAEALHSMRRGEKGKVLESLQHSLREHLTRGSVQALGRILRLYLPLILEQSALPKGRELLENLETHHFQERDFGPTAERLVDLIWLTGDFGDWNLVETALGNGTHLESRKTLFPRPTNHVPSQSVTLWVKSWEGVPEGEFLPLDEGSSELRALQQAWIAMTAGNLIDCRRSLLQSEPVDLRGSLFGFLRAVLHQAISEKGGTKELRWQEEILQFWYRLPPPIVVQQLNYWEDLLQRRGPDFPQGLVETLKSWLTTIQRWRVEKALLLDETLGEVYFGGKHHHLGVDTIPFSLLSFLARRPDLREPVCVEELFESVWERRYSPPSSNSSVYVTIGNLRQILDFEGTTGSVIGLERGKGYYLDVPVVIAPSFPAQATLRVNGTL